MINQLSFIDNQKIENFDLFKLDITEEIFDRLKSKITFSQSEIFLYGKTHKIPRLEAWFGHSEYTYTQNTLTPAPWFEEILMLKSLCEAYAKTQFNSALVNLYRNGDDYVSWHQDNEKELGDMPIIASLSLGQSRTFQIRRKNNPKEKHSFILEHGDLVIMRGDFQQIWEHQISKTKRACLERINITFRTL